MLSRHWWHQEGLANFIAARSYFHASLVTASTSGPGSESVERLWAGVPGPAAGVGFTKSTASTEAPGSLLGLQTKGGSGCSTESVILLCQALSLKPHKLPDDENQTAPFKGTLCQSLLFISTCWGYSKHSQLQPFSQSGSTKAIDMISKS